MLMARGNCVSVQFTILIRASHSPQIETTVGEAKKQLLGQLESYSIHAKRPRQAETVRDKHKAKTQTDDEL